MPERKSPRGRVDHYAAWVKAARGRRELRAEELADLSNVTVRDIMEIEDGNLWPSFEIMDAISAALADDTLAVPRPSNA